MPKERYTPEEVIQHLRTVELDTGKGLGVLDACRKLGITEQKYGQFLNGGDDGLQGTRQHLHGGSRCVTIFVTRLGGTGKDRTNGTLQANEIATNLGKPLQQRALSKMALSPS